jgi:hypothetical protein
MPAVSNNHISVSNTLGKNALTNNDFFFGVTGGDDYGSTSNSGFYNGVVIPVGGYVIYFNNSGTITADAPTNDTECLYYLNRYGANAANISDALTWASAQPNIVVRSSEYTLGDLVTPTPTPSITPTNTPIPTPTPTPTPTTPPTLYAVLISTVYGDVIAACNGNANITAYSTNPGGYPQDGDIYYTTSAGTTTYGAGFYKNGIYDSVFELDSSGVLTGGLGSCN